MGNNLKAAVVYQDFHRPCGEEIDVLMPMLLLRRPRVGRVMCSELEQFEWDFDV